MLSFMKIHPVGTELFHAVRCTDRRTDRYDEANSRFSSILLTRLKKIENDIQRIKSNKNISFQDREIKGRLQKISQLEV